MSVSESQKQARNKWDKKNMVVLHCKLKKEHAERFRLYAQEQGKTVNELLKEYVLQCIN